MTKHKKKAYIFPGQGSQFTGMGKEIYYGNSKAKDILEYANEVLKYRITDIMFNGAEDELKKTNIAQLVIFLYSFTLAKISKDFTPDIVAGHSLGEISALAAAEIISFEDALLLVKARGEAMQRACMENKSTMIAVLGMEDKVIEEICNQITEDLVMPVNYNCTGQVVISGTLDGIKKASNKLAEMGAKRIIPINVEGGFHTPLMKSAKDGLRTVINTMSFKKSDIPICQNKTANITTDISEIKLNLIEQITSPVLWKQSMHTMVDLGIKIFIECGTTNVLTKFAQKTLNANSEIEYMPLYY